MEQDIKLGQVADLDLKLSGGKATVTLTAGLEVPGVALSLKSVSSASMDAAILIDKLFAAIEAKSPPGVVAVEEGVKALVKAAAMAL